MNGMESVLYIIGLVSQGMQTGPWSGPSPVAHEYACWFLPLPTFLVASFSELPKLPLRLPKLSYEAVISVSYS